MVLDGLRSFSDQDGDGFSAEYDHGDCDDTNPDIHPMAIEILDNDVDENCQGGPGRSGPPRRSQPEFVAKEMGLENSERTEVVKPRQHQRHTMLSLFSSILFDQTTSVCMGMRERPARTWIDLAMPLSYSNMLSPMPRIHHVRFPPSSWGRIRVESSG